MKRILITKDDVYRGSLILINPDYPLKTVPPAPALTSAFSHYPHVLLETQAAKMLCQLLLKIEANGNIVPVSGYRTHKEQLAIWNSTLKSKGAEFTKKYVAPPGHSEHESGLAIDLALKAPRIDFICPDFPRSGICQTFRRLAPRFGFIERYPACKEEITHIGAEPWHFRYIGFPHAQIMAEKQMTLEEYLLFLKKESCIGKPFYYKTECTGLELTYLSMKDREKMELTFSCDDPHTLSGTNTDGVILCRWRKSYA